MNDAIRHQIMALLRSTDPDADSVVNALLATQLVYRALVPVTQRGKHQFEPDGEIFDEHPGSMRGERGWLIAPRYTSSVDAAIALVQRVFDGEAHTLTLEAKPTFATARILWRHGSTGWHTCGPDKSARAIIFCLMEVLDKNDPTKAAA